MKTYLIPYSPYGEKGQLVVVYAESPRKALLVVFYSLYLGIENLKESEEYLEELERVDDLPPTIFKDLLEVNGDFNTGMVYDTTYNVLYNSDKDN